MAYVDKIQNKAGTLYDIQDARMNEITSSDVNKFVKVVETNNGYELGYDNVDVSGAIATHNTAVDAHSDIRGLVTAEASARTEADAAINAKIPSAASSTNQLADKEFVNSSISTETAHYISNNGEPFTSVAQLEAYSGTVTNNDYAFVTGTDEAGNTYFDRYKASVSGSTVTWAKEYRLNNSSFTAAQWAAISSGITSSKVTEFEGKYTKPAGGIPSSDFAVQPRSISVTLPAIAAAGTANVTVTGLGANDVGVFGLAPSASAAQYAAAAASQLQVIAQAANQITVRANGDALAAGVPAILNIIG